MCTTRLPSKKVKIRTDYLLNDGQAVPPDVDWHWHQQVLWGQVQLHHHVITVNSVSQFQPHQLMLLRGIKYTRSQFWYCCAIPLKYSFVERNILP